MRDRYVASVETEVMKAMLLETNTGGWISLRDEIVEISQDKNNQDKVLMGGMVMRYRDVALVETEVMKAMLLETKTGATISLRDEIVEIVLIGFGRAKTKMNKTNDRDVALVETEVMKAMLLETKRGGWISLRDDI
ncbi:hypothetical protein BY996DRAFT_6559308, partial [Phakopsora pachyrhizi]